MGGSTGEVEGDMGEDDDENDTDNNKTLKNPMMLTQQNDSRWR